MSTGNGHILGIQRAQALKVFPHPSLSYLHVKLAGSALAHDLHSGCKVTGTSRRSGRLHWQALASKNLPQSPLLLLLCCCAASECCLRGSRCRRASCVIKLAAACMIAMLQEYRR